MPPLPRIQAFFKGGSYSHHHSPLIIPQKRPFFVGIGVIFFGDYIPLDSHKKMCSRIPFTRLLFPWNMRVPESHASTAAAARSTNKPETSEPDENNKVKAKKKNTWVDLWFMFDFYDIYILATIVIVLQIYHPNTKLPNSIPSAPIIPCSLLCLKVPFLTHNPKPRLQNGAVSIKGHHKFPRFHRSEIIYHDLSWHYFRHRLSTMHCSSRWSDLALESTWIIVVVDINAQDNWAGGFRVICFH